MLCGNPEIGECFHGDPTGTIRHRSILKFTNYLIFYRQEGSNLQVLRIIHVARDDEKFFE
jgi:plasmid stabilization system protein ParE